MVCLVDYKNLIGLSKPLRSTLLVGDTEFDASMRDACLSVVSSPRSSMVVFCLDGDPQFRFDLLPSYKEGRKSESMTMPRYPVHLLLQDIARVGQTYNKPVVFALSPGLEADDVIASIALGVNESSEQDLTSDQRLSWWVGLGAWKKLYLNARNFCILSSDSDLLQLLRDDSDRSVKVVKKLSLVDATTNLPASWVKRDVSSPGELLSWKVFEGDSSDKIPRARTVRPSKVGSLFWKTLNTPHSLVSFATNPDTNPTLAEMIDIEKLRLNIKMIYLQPSVTPYFLQLC